ncbi:alkaline phosphatase family protein [Leucobacter luti]|uniref:Putative AlkP superfamily pyrophosphatase or phosphodiesterase n=1 Tax=Leucobacter luti TaxID=340320 RepID=A0A4Q7TJD1_9MICO|nr:nucleotide pyrophosphatase/phosphodiesterase family protein [Leucobacter luti]MBL3700382.1 alkaline phosphatase family protein [Leucobacter luti]RZT60553.1 putative AlkP superfamily pyrophosphatase or phosphodiesterase [Leucobacter luti]
MLPTAADNGARLAAILPSGIAAVASGLGRDPRDTLSEIYPGAGSDGFKDLDLGLVPKLRSLVLIVVDGLGHANLRARRGHAPTLSGLPQRRIETVAPSTTGAALTTITTGRLPGAHGLIGYRIRHPELGLVTTLSEWDGIPDRRSWQLADPLFANAAALGARPVVIGRPAHASGGLTEAILTGADYLPGQRIEDRFALGSQALRRGEPTVMYLYVDELDRAAHEFGVESAEWVRRLEQLDAALADFLRTLPGDTGVVVTADHGIVDVAPQQQVLLDSDPELLAGVGMVGGEPRFRSLYLEPGIDPAEVQRRWAAAEGDRAWVSTRDEAIASGVFGPVAPGVAERLGDVLIAARKRVAYTLSTDDPGVHAMVGQHGSFSDEERGVPLALGGALAGTGFGALVTAVAARSRVGAVANEVASVND